MDYPPHINNIRPKSITTLSVLYSLISLIFLLKVNQVFFQWNRLVELPLTVSPTYLIVNGLVWCISGFVIALGLWKGKYWSSPAAVILSLLYSLVFWIDQIWISEPEVLLTRWPINLVYTIFGLGLIFIILNKKSSRAYFNRNPVKIA